MRASFLTFILILSVAQSASAAAFKDWWTSAREMGMGGAYSAVVRDSDAIFINPAALARVSGVTWTAFDPRVGADGLDVVSEYTNFKSTTDLAGFIDQRWGKNYWAGGGGKTAVALPYFGAAAFSAADLSLLAENPANPVVNLDYAADYGFAMGAAIDLVPSLVSIGFTGKRITRVGTSGPIGAATLADLSSSQLKQEIKNRGSGYGLDAGLLMTFPTPVRPSLSIVYHNLGYTSFNHEGGLRAPARMTPELDLGTALTVDAPLIAITPSLEYTNINDNTAQLGKKLNLGLEVHMPVIDIRGGLHQGYYALGFGFNLGVLRVDAATYGVELGEYPGQHEDRRYMAQVSFDLGFDIGNFSGTDSRTGQRTHLKRRR